MAAVQMSRLQPCTAAPPKARSGGGGGLGRAVSLGSNLSWVSRINPRLCTSVPIPVELSSQESRGRATSCVLASGSSVESEDDMAVESGMTWLSSVDDNPMADWIQKGEDGDDMLREECGVVAIFGDPEAGRLCYLALHALQHRGQEGAGMVTADEGTLHAVTGKKHPSS